eukprot:3934764-Rhodomonas_salina.1
MVWYKQGATPIVYTYENRRVCDKYRNTHTTPSLCPIHLAIKLPPKSPAKKGGPIRCRRRGLRGRARRGLCGYPGTRVHVYRVPWYRVVGCVGELGD